MFISLNWKVVDPISEKLGDLFAFPLRGHMTCAVNGGEIETIIANEISGHLTVCVPRIPIFLDGPVKHLNPSTSAICRNCTISVTRVEKHLISVLLHDFVDPVAALILISIVLIDSVIAFKPGLNVIWDIHGTSNILSVGIVAQVISKKRVLRRFEEL